MQQTDSTTAAKCPSCEEQASIATWPARHLTGGRIAIAACEPCGWNKVVDNAR